MGGGDLNLKKSWHTATLKNIEKVWLLEQAAEEERKRGETLKKEKEQERQIQELKRLYEQNKLSTTSGSAGGGYNPKMDRMDWMYAGAAGANSGNNLAIQEEFLLGKRKATELLQESKHEDNIPGASSHTLPPINMQDMESKLRLDPVFSIKQKEQAQLRQIIQAKLLFESKRSIRNATGRQATGLESYRRSGTPHNRHNTHSPYPSQISRRDEHSPERNQPYSPERRKITHQASGKRHHSPTSQSHDNYRDNSYQLEEKIYYKDPKEKRSEREFSKNHRTRHFRSESDSKSSKPDVHLESNTSSREARLAAMRSDALSLESTRTKDLAKERMISKQERDQLVAQHNLDASTGRVKDSSSSLSSTSFLETTRKQAYEKAVSDRQSRTRH